MRCKCSSFAECVCLDDEEKLARMKYEPWVERYMARYPTMRHSEVTLREIYAERVANLRELNALVQTRK